MATLDAFALLGGAWRSGSIVMQLQLGSATLSDGSSSWNTPGEGALATWNAYLSRASLQVVRDSTAPIAQLNGYNNVAWANDVYGSAFGSHTLATTIVWSSAGTIVEADVLINRAQVWNSYRGVQKPGVYDIRRVLLHEFGHVVGLDHPDQVGQAVSSIMNSTIGNLEQLTNDDVSGARALYGGSSPAPAPVPSASLPGAPRSLTVSSSGTSVFLTWSAPANGSASSTYVIEAGSGPGLANLANFATGGVATSYSTTGVGNGVFYVRVRARNATGTSAASNEAILLVSSGTCTGAPTAPTGLIGGATGATVTLAWNPSGGNPTSYVVEAGSAPGLTNLANSDTGSTVPSLTAPGVGRGLYYVRVRGKNNCGVGAASNEVVVVVQ